MFYYIMLFFTIPNKKIFYTSFSLFFDLEFILKNLIFFQIYVHQQSKMDYSYTCILLISRLFVQIFFFLMIKCDYSITRFA